MELKPLNKENEVKAIVLMKMMPSQQKSAPCRSPFARYKTARG